MESTPPQLPIWVCETDDITPFEVSHFRTTLPEDEIQRASRFYTSELQTRALLTRFLVRQGLSAHRPEYTPFEWQFETNAYGKPSVKNILDQPIFFNVSHSASIIAIAFGYFPTLGLDVEQIKNQRKHDFLSIAEHSFSDAEIKALRNTVPAKQAEHFYRLWTLKEALIKAVGKGLSMGLKSFGFTDLEFSKDTLNVCKLQGPFWQNYTEKTWRFNQRQWGNYMLAGAALPPDINEPLAIQTKQVKVLPTSKNKLDINVVDVSTTQKWANTHYAKD